MDNFSDFRKTKILATLGPATDSKQRLEGLIESGANAFRLNFSHGDRSYFESLFFKIAEVCESHSLPIAVLQDLQGPKIRIGELSEKEIEVFSGDLIEITTRDIRGTRKKISASYKFLSDDASVGDRVLIDDGLIHLSVIEKKSESIICEIINGGILKSRKGMNLPGMKLSTPSVTEKDYYDLEFALKHRVDFIALSFVRSPNEIYDLRKWMISKGYNKPVIAKIEKREAVDNFEEILNASDGIMIARGDLGVELKPQDVPVIQKKIIRRCNEKGKLVITATQMLESMIQSPVPTRAEASDVANAVWDGTDVVMLSGETAVGKHPIEAVNTMREILKTTEKESNPCADVKFEIPGNLADNIFDSTGKAAADISTRINASAIVVFTHYGRKAKVISKYRPGSPIIAISDKLDTLNNLSLHRGIQSFFLENVDAEDPGIKQATSLLLEYKLIKQGDLIIFTAGAPITDKERRSWMHFVVV